MPAHNAPLPTAPSQPPTRGRGGTTTARCPGGRRRKLSGRRPSVGLSGHRGRRPAPTTPSRRVSRAATGQTPPAPPPWLAGAWAAARSGPRGLD
eukprot:3079254-Lingulodinium_polyedra.AAC.1